MSQDKEYKGVSDADIDAALKQLRAEAGGHEPYAPGVWPRAQAIAAKRKGISIEDLAK